MPTPFQEHLARWANCQDCELAARRKHLVFARGRLPCDLLFVGEAPGESEDVLGLPFVGPAGKLLDAIIRDAQRLSWPWSWAMTNLTCCIPREEDGAKAGEPPDEAIMACKPRLEELGRLAAPRLTVCVGKLSADWVAGGLLRWVKIAGPKLEIHHPAYILRSNYVQRGLMIQRCTVQIAQAVREHLGERPPENRVRL